MSRRTQFRRRAAAGLTHPVFRYPFNEAFFDFWSDDLAWLIGLVWSDGCLFNNSVMITSKDRELLQCAASLIHSESVVPHSTPNSWRMMFTSPRTASFLRDIGLTPAKSLTIGWPVLPAEYEGPFLRGVIDGDGCVRLSHTRPGQRVSDLTVTIATGSPAFAKAMVDCFARHDIAAASRASLTKWNKHPVTQVKVCRQESLHKLHRLIYPHPNTPCLSRKRVPFDQWVATPRAPSGRMAKAAVPDSDA